MSRQTMLVVAVASSWLALASTSARAQTIPGDGKDVNLSAAQRGEVIEGALKHLDRAYIFPDVAKKMAAAIRERVDKKEYDNITSGRELAVKLTSHLQEVSHDQHLRVSYSAEPFPKYLQREPTAKEREEMRRFAAVRNFGFEKVERLSGNVGYLDLRGFMPVELAGDTAAAAMNFLANTEALIIDLRQNGGGSPAMVAMLCSYLFPAEPVVHLNDLYYRPDNSTHQWWTLPYVPGKRYLGKSVYVLTSKRTFSAAEEFTYNLRNLKRATIVGEITGGGAHPGGPQPINDHFSVWVPTGRAINPISKTNWEGTGVKPDIEVPADLALKTAHFGALKKVRDTAAGDPEQTKHLNEIIQKLEKELKTKDVSLKKQSVKQRDGKSAD
jgi:retinol-binding protein 3